MRAELQELSLLNAAHRMACLSRGWVKYPPFDPEASMRELKRLENAKRIASRNVTTEEHRAMHREYSRLWRLAHKKPS